MIKKTIRGFHWRGVVGALILGPLAITALISTPFVQEGSLLDWAVDAVAFTLYLAGLTFRFWATLYVGGRKGSAVVAEGPYSVCRNPLYLGSLLLVAALGLFIKSWAFAVGILYVSLRYILVRVPAEEKQLKERHGEEYVQFCRRVPRFIPRLSLFHTPPEITVSIKGLWRECQRQFPWIWIPLVGELIALLRSQPWMPHYF